MANRLKNEKSPYLQQHSDNPVDWQPWDEKALKEAEKQDKPIFLSIGYSACHWCHVMEEESFEDEEVANILNKNFIPIKVDREERPDLDKLYQTACQLSTGRGGWPLSVFLTPDGRPFYAGTYFPKEEKRGMPSFIDVLEGIKEMWEEKRDEVEKRSSEWSSKLEKQFEIDYEKGEIEENLLTVAAGQAVHEADREYGGFGNAPKFPHPSRIEVLLRSYEREKKDVYLNVAKEALEGMANGGIRDHLSGGFHRYSTDRKWKVPHFEKMLYDNAELSRVYTEGYRVTGDAKYSDIAKETLNFLEREMKNEKGGFYSTLDARSEGKEGKYYIWNRKEVKEIIGDEKAEIFCEHFGVGNRQVEGKSVLNIEKSINEIAKEREKEKDEINDIIEKSKKELLRHREEERKRPDRDEKIISEWNGLTVSALCRAGFVLGEEKYLDLASETLKFIRKNMWDGEKLYRRYKDGEVAVEGCLGDYAFLGKSAIDLHGITGDLSYLDFAISLGDKLIDEFWEDGSVYLSNQKLVVRPTENQDSSMPSSTGGAAQFLVKLSAFREEFEEYGRKILEKHSSEIDTNPLNHVSLVLASDLYHNPLEALIVAEKMPEEWRQKLVEISPDIMSIKPPKSEDRKNLKTEPPLWRKRDQKDGNPTLYICSGSACSPPLTEIKKGSEWKSKLI